MNFTSKEIRDIVSIARSNPHTDYTDIIQLIINGHKQKSLIKTIISNVTSTGKNKPTKLRPTTKEILEKVSLVHSIPVETMQKKNRKQEVIRAKQQYCLIAVLFHYSQESAAKKVSMSHCTVFFHKNKALGFYQLEPDYTAEVDLIFEQFPDFEMILKDRITDLIYKQDARIKD